MYKEHKVVMLPTSEAEGLGLIVLNPRFKVLGQAFGKNIEGAQHLYILSDNKVVKDDWCVNDNMDTVYQLSLTGYYERWNKIIATTDKLKLKPACTCSETAAIDCGKPKAIGKCQQYIPQLSTEFINYYIDEYNKGNVVTSVIVEYDEVIDVPQHLLLTNSIEEMECIKHPYFRLKVNDDNNINIQLPKTTFTRDEVVQHLIYCVSELATSFGFANTAILMEAWNEATHKWINDNLH